MDDRFAVLFVCTGNICRSPMAERLCALRTSGYPAIGVSSAGTNGLNGYPMDAPSVTVLRELGGDPGGHVARRLDSDLLVAADLVLTATREQRGAALRLGPSTMRRTFTMREFGRLGVGLGRLDTVDVRGLRERVATVAARRGTAPVPTPESSDDIADPYGASPDVVRRLGREVSQAVDDVMAALGLIRRPARPPAS